MPRNVRSTLLARIAFAAAALVPAVTAAAVPPALPVGTQPIRPIPGAIQTVRPIGSPSPHQTQAPAARAITFDVILTVDPAALAASGTQMATLCGRITVSVATFAGVYTLQGHTPLFDAPKLVAAQYLPGAGGGQICYARYTHVSSYAEMMIGASYAGAGAPFTIGASSENFWEDPTSLTGASEAPSPYTNDVYRGMSVRPQSEVMPHPTNPHRG